MHHFVHRYTKIDIFWYIVAYQFLFVFDSFSYRFRILSNSTYIEILFYFCINVKTIWHFTQLHFNAISHIQFWTNSFSKVIMAMHLIIQFCIKVSYVTLSIFLQVEFGTKTQKYDWWKIYFCTSWMAMLADTYHYSFHMKLGTYKDLWRDNNLELRQFLSNYCHNNLKDIFLDYCKHSDKSLRITLSSGRQHLRSCTFL